VRLRAFLGALHPGFFSSTLEKKCPFAFSRSPNGKYFATKILAHKEKPPALFGEYCQIESMYIHGNSAMSYTWRSIMWGIQVLRSGVIWRVGNGEK